MGLAGSTTATRAGVRRRAEVPVATDARYAGGHRRGYVVRRALLVADIVALLVSFVATEILLGRVTWGDLDPRVTKLFVIFLLSLPVWVVAAKVYGLYDRDEERTEHTTVDDLVGVFHLVTVSVWILFAGAWATGVTTPQIREHDDLLDHLDRPHHVVQGGRACARPAERRVRPARARDRRRRRRTARLPEGAAPSRVRDRRRRHRRRRAARAATRARGYTDLSARRISTCLVDRLRHRSRGGRVRVGRGRRAARSAAVAPRPRGAGRPRAAAVRDHPAERGRGRGGGPAARGRPAGRHVAVVEAREARAWTSCCRRCSSCSRAPSSSCSPCS